MKPLTKSKWGLDLIKAFWPASLVFVIGLLLSPPLTLFYLALAVVVYLLLFSPRAWTAVIVAASVTMITTSCAREHYWSAYSTPHGTKAQEQYIRNMKGHKEGKRFYSSSSPTFGAHDLHSSKRAKRKK